MKNKTKMTDAELRQELKGIRDVLHQATLVLDEMDKRAQSKKAASRVRRAQV
ncbi:MAG: hypothetical protein ABUS54_10235 [Actinomycetota bacterium]